ncbi:MAG: hypothetical protein ISQ06_03655 [Planctomycetaceae bacterium]|jgi:hypothetical protein|nr:hypothetical protein [Planctomycetaceae bacterium]
MANLHVLLYSAAAILALRSFVQLVTNYRNEYEHIAVSEHLTKMAEELEAQKANGGVEPELNSPKQLSLPTQKKQAAAI